MTAPSHTQINNFIGRFDQFFALAQETYPELDVLQVFENCQDRSWQIMRGSLGPLATSRQFFHSKPASALATALQQAHETALKAQKAVAPVMAQVAASPALVATPIAAPAAHAAMPTAAPAALNKVVVKQNGSSATCKLIGAVAAVAVAVTAAYFARYSL